VAGTQTQVHLANITSMVTSALLSQLQQKYRILNKKYAKGGDVEEWARVIN